MDWSGALRRTLRERALAWANAEGLPYYMSLGQESTVLFEGDGAGQGHGNFDRDAWRTILSKPSWRARLDKPHSQSKALPPEKAAAARELDSSNSSDALLMNCFCYPGAATRILKHLDLPSEPNAQPDSG
jgi:hypothetical protein